jgi:virulence-associated protein VagC
MRASILEAEDGGQIVVFPPGFEIDASTVLIEQDGPRVVITPLACDGDETDSKD